MSLRLIPSLTCLGLAGLTAERQHLAAGDAAPGTSCGGFAHFITRQGDKLMDGDKEFRFIGANMPGLILPYDFTLRLPERMVLPTRWEQADGFRTLRQMNLRVVRLWNLPMRGPEDDEHTATWAYVLGPGRFNEVAFRVLDQALALANAFGIRVILPLSADAGDYLGGIGTYAAWRGRKREEFFTDPQCRADYQATLRYVITRRNTITGQRYCDDKAILAWQFGNEMRAAPLEWEGEMAAFIKRLDPNHLVIAGHDQRVPTNPPPALDILTRHYYGGDWVKNCRADRAAARGQRPFIVGEFGLETNVATVRRFLDEVLANGTSGALIWSLYFHHEAGGFFWHQIITRPAANSYHWPGFASGAQNNEAAILALLREFAHRIQGLPVPALPVPEAPVLLPISARPLLSWRGATGAAGYDVQRAPNSTGPWETIATNVSDADTPYRPLFNDRTARAGQTYFYRVAARNESGASPPSAPVGPVRFETATWADELMDFRLADGHSPGLALANDRSGLYAEYLYRARGTNGHSLRYVVAGQLTEARVVAWSTDRNATLRFEVSADGVAWQPVAAEGVVSRPGQLVKELVAKGHQQRHLIEYRLTALPPARWLKLTWQGALEVDRVELDHR